ncbi:proteasome accessory factor PafA2 family protein [Actinomyces gaoshouyii]|uniref:proteasome accessory factor PafA2 family protein n=1 Tax=Actinomyces gaoshouyii TaxID=1960083 RepID=UPI0009BE4237|nr:proteasome accessory factor PafA2 family protein [Actinomyces gaoshouyii]ARD41753.1 proteasome accessory factor PafA2 [Actinomyces gaoshouyii]
MTTSATSMPVIAQAPVAAALGPTTRPVGLETEFGVTEPGNSRANPVVLSSLIVDAYAARSRPGLPGAASVTWDYEGEDPLADLRGGRIDRAAAHPSQLTDDPTAPAPSGDAPADGGPVGLDWGTRPRPSDEEAALPRATTAVLANGARLYVDHAHPEYSAPEALTPTDALAWDRAGEVIARRAMEARARSGGPEIVLYKNNTDGKGAAYGSHENYLVRRDLPLDALAAALTPFLMTRPVVVGAGRVGLGERSERPGFQMSQRADFIGCPIGLQTTFNRPIVNTRDEPHADAARWRRFHVINGDANRFDVPGYLKIATTDLLLWFLERSHERGEGIGALAPLRILGDPVEQQWALSHDATLAYALTTQGGPMSAVAIQRSLLEVIAAALEADYGGIGAQNLGEETARALALWEEALGLLEAIAAAPGDLQPVAAAAPMIEWAAKMQLCEGLRARSGTDWSDPRLAALDITWGDLREGSVVDRLDAAGRVRRLLDPSRIEAAADTPPAGTRAAVRGRAIATIPEVVSASWTSLVIDAPQRPQLIRVALPGAVAVTEAETEGLLTAIERAAQGGGDWVQ